MTLNRRTFLNLCASTAVMGGVAAPLKAWAADQQVNYGGSAWLGHYPAYLAMTDGYFKEVGINQSWQSFGTSSSRMSAVMSGGLDIAGTGVVSALALMARGAKQFSIIAIPESFGRVEGILARDNIKSIQDLKGKKLGVTFASSAHMLVLDLIAKAGMTESDVEVLNVSAPELPAAMAAGQIDAAGAWTPQFDAIRKQPGVHVLADDRQFSLYQSNKVTPGPDVLVVRKAYAEKNPDTVKAYLKAYFKANGVLHDQPEAAAKSLIALTHLSEEDQIGAIKGADWYTQAQQAEILKGSYIDGLQKLAELLVTYKQIDKAPVVKDWIDASFI
jgi:taurine transport system substrate-binding protein